MESAQGAPGTFSVDFQHRFNKETWRNWPRQLQDGLAGWAGLGCITNKPKNLSKTCPNNRKPKKTCKKPIKTKGGNEQTNKT